MLFRFVVAYVISCDVNQRACREGQKNNIRRYAVTPIAPPHPPTLQVQNTPIRRSPPLQAQNTPIRRCAAPTRRYADTPIHPPRDPPGPEYAHTPIRRSPPPTPPTPKPRIRRYADTPISSLTPLQAQNTPIRRCAAPTRRYADTPIHPPRPQYADPPPPTDPQAQNIRRYADAPLACPEKGTTPIRQSPPTDPRPRIPIRRYADSPPDAPGPEYADTPPRSIQNTPIRRPPPTPGPEYADTPIRRSPPMRASNVLRSASELMHVLGLGVS